MMRVIPAALLCLYAFLNTGSGGWHFMGQVRAASPVTGYPSKPLRWLVPASPGAGTDTVARIFGQKVSEVLKQSVVIDNRGGAAGKIGMELVARAAPDGYSVIVISITQLLSTSLSRATSLDLTKDFAPVSLLTKVPIVMVIHPSVNARTLQEFIALARSQPGQMSYGSGGTGAVQHVATELFKREAKIDLVHVPYKGAAPALIDLLGGRIQIFMTNATNVLPYVKTGKLRMLGISSAKRLPQAPDVPTFLELGLSGISVNIWYGMLVPARTPTAIIDKLSQSIATVVRMPDVRARMSGEGIDLIGSTPAEFGLFLRSESEKWRKVAHDAGISID